MKVGETLLNEFNSLPDRAKVMWFGWLWETAMQDSCDAIMFLPVYGFSTEGCKSPIEQIFMFAFSIYRFSNYGKDFDEGLCLETQFQIESLNGKNYVADFLLYHEFAKIGSRRLVIECDGHEYHNATKEQVEHDNLRDMDIKESGYDIIHFSGSQLFKYPMKCAEQAYKYFKSITVLDTNTK